MLTVFTVDFQLGALFFVLSLRLVFIYHWKKSFLKLIFRVIEVLSSLQRTRDRRANVPSMAAFTGMLLNFNISIFLNFGDFLS